VGEVSSGETATHGDEAEEPTGESASAGDTQGLPLAEWSAAAAEADESFDRAIVEAVYASADACALDPDWDFAAETTRPRLFAVDAGTLVWLFCELGAYQEVGALYWVEETRVSLLSLDYVDAAGERSRRDLTGFFEYDPATREVTDSTKYRGLGDCGSFARYRLTAGALELLEHRERECDDDYEGDEPPPMTEWPRRFP